MVEMDLRDNLELGTDGVVRIGDVVARPSDVPLRHDLRPGHPMYSARTVKNVPSGMPDCVVDDSGVLVVYTGREIEIPDIVDFVEKPR